MDGWLQTEKVCTFFCLWTRSLYASQTDRHHFCSHAILLCSFSIFHFGPVSFLHPPVGFIFGKITRLLWLVLEKCIGGWIASVQTGGRPPPSPLVLRGGVLVWGGGGSNALVATLSHTHRLSKWFCHHCDCQGTLRLASIALILGLFVCFELFSWLWPDTWGKQKTGVDRSLSRWLSAQRRWFPTMYVDHNNNLRSSKTPPRGRVLNKQQSRTGLRIMETARSALDNCPSGPEGRINREEHIKWINPRTWSLFFHILKWTIFHSRNTQQSSLRTWKMDRHGQSGYLVESQTNRQERNWINSRTRRPRSKTTNNAKVRYSKQHRWHIDQS